MSKNRYSQKVDANQPQIVEDLRELGISVQVGMDDILCGYKGRTYWIEIKTPDCVNAKGELIPSKVKDSQHKLLAEWKGFYMIAWSTEQILKAIGFRFDSILEEG